MPDSVSVHPYHKPCSIPVAAGDDHFVVPVTIRIVDSRGSQLPGIFDFNPTISLKFLS